MDEYMVDNNLLLTELVRQWNKHKQIIIAYDFDDTVRPYRKEDCKEVQEVLRDAARVLKPYFIVFTCNKDIDYIKRFLFFEQIPYNSINMNSPYIPEWVSNPNKIYYNILLDDKAGLEQSLKALKDLIYLVENKILKRGEYGE